MLRRVKDFENYILRARDVDIGKAKEFLFDDHEWTVRYMVAETGGWIDGRKVLISPHALNPAIGYDHVFPIDLTKEQIENSPSLESDQPVSRQFELEYYGYYGWPYYGDGNYLWGASPFLWGWNEPLAEERTPSTREASWDPNLRSTNEVSGYHVHALDGEVGHVEDFIIDEDNWTIRYLILDTKNWWPGRRVLVSPQWIKEVSWGESKVFVDLSKAAIEESPEYSAETLNRGYEEKLHEHYNSHGYWENQPQLRPPVASAEERLGATK